jgi:hypothetical protein
MNPFTQTFEDLPPTLPVFPLNGVLLLPGGTLPLNIFEPRYLEMVNDALAGDRLIGMIQPRDFENGRYQQKPDLQSVGCAGRITEFSETEDGRYEISLIGLCRFSIAEELAVTTHYRLVKPDWTPYRADYDPPPGCCEGMCKDRLKDLLKEYFQLNGMNCEWTRIDEAPKEKLLTCLSMICPFGAREKQALLEAPTIKDRAELFLKLLEFAVADSSRSESGTTHH